MFLRELFWKYFHLSSDFMGEAGTELPCLGWQIRTGDGHAVIWGVSKDGAEGCGLGLGRGEI